MTTLKVILQKQKNQQINPVTYGGADEFNSDKNNMKVNNSGKIKILLTKTHGNTRQQV